MDGGDGHPPKTGTRDEVGVRSRARGCLMGGFLASGIFLPVSVCNLSSGHAGEGETQATLLLWFLKRVENAVPCAWNPKE